MSLLRRIFCVSATLIAAHCVCAVTVHAAVISAASASYVDVTDAVSAASSGDTVEVPAGSATWSNTLTITKRLTLRGAGPGQTVITAGVSGTLIQYLPADAFSSSPFRLTGFTLNAASTGNNLLRLDRETTANVTWIRIDHNRFNCGTAAVSWIAIGGRTYGVFDNNVFDNACGFLNYGQPDAGGVESWQNLSFTPGTIYNLYYEDNTFNTCFSTQTAGHGGRYAVRYNTFNLQNPSNCFGALSGFYPLNDAHGNQGSYVYGTQGVEFYGNRVTSSWNIAPFLAHRGGKALVFWNKIVNSASTSTYVREECEDSIGGTETPTAPDGTPQHVNNTYYWNNRAGANGTMLLGVTMGTLGASNCGGYPATVPLVENQDYFVDTALSDGSRGVGCGTTLPATCSVGSDLKRGTPAFWVSTQSCGSISDANVGVNPPTPLSGTLFQCAATNSWTAYFTPYTYPHPLQRGGGDTLPPAAPPNLRRQ